MKAVAKDLKLAGLVLHGLDVLGRCRCCCTHAIVLDVFAHGRQNGQGRARELWDLFAAKKHVCLVVVV